MPAADPAPTAAPGPGGIADPEESDRVVTYPEHRDEYPDEQADDERILRDVPPHY